MQKHFEFLLLGGGPASVSAARRCAPKARQAAFFWSPMMFMRLWPHASIEAVSLWALPEEKLLSIRRLTIRRGDRSNAWRPCSRRGYGEPACAFGWRWGHPFRQATDRDRHEAYSPDHPGFRASRHSLPAYFGGCRGAEAGCQETPSASSSSAAVTSVSRSLHRSPAWAFMSC